MSSPWLCSTLTRTSPLPVVRRLRELGHDVVLCTYDPDFAGQATRIHEQLSVREEMTGSLLRVYRGTG